MPFYEPCKGNWKITVRFGYPMHTEYIWDSVRAQWGLNLWDPMDDRLPGSSVHGISQGRILEWFPISSSRVSSQSRDRNLVSCISCIGRWFFAIEPPGMNSKMGSQHLLTTDTPYSVHVLIGHLLKANTKHQSYTDTGVNKEPGLMLQIVYIS